MKKTPKLTRKGRAVLARALLTPGFHPCDLPGHKLHSKRGVLRDLVTERERRERNLDPALCRAQNRKRATYNARAPLSKAARDGEKILDLITGDEDAPLPFELILKQAEIVSKRMGMNLMYVPNSPKRRDLTDLWSRLKMLLWYVRLGFDTQAKSDSKFVDKMLDDASETGKAVPMQVTIAIDSLGQPHASVELLDRHAASAPAGSPTALAAKKAARQIGKTRTVTGQIERSLAAPMCEAASDAELRGYLHPNRSEPGSPLRVAAEAEFASRSRYGSLADHELRPLLRSPSPDTRRHARAEIRRRGQAGEK